VTSNNTPTTWTRGTIHNITWSSYGVSGKVYVYLVNGTTWETLDIPGGPVSASSGTYSWNIPLDVTPFNKYLIRVFSKANINVTDYSDAYLTIN
jgi:hypothetical protein